MNTPQFGRSIWHYFSSDSARAQLGSLTSRSVFQFLCSSSLVGSWRKGFQRCCWDLISVVKIRVLFFNPIRWVVWKFVFYFTIEFGECLKKSCLIFQSVSASVMKIRIFYFTILDLVSFFNNSIPILQSDSVSFLKINILFYYRIGWVLKTFVFYLEMGVRASNSWHLPFFGKIRRISRNAKILCISIMPTKSSCVFCHVMYLIGFHWCDI